MDNLFFARIDDLRQRADRGEVAVSSFFNEAECAAAERYLSSFGDARHLFFGGYPDAERRRLFVFPDWAEPSVETAGEYVAPLLIRGSGYVELDHRSFLGALTGAGLSRGVIGDIVVEDKSSAVVFFDAAIADYLLGTSGALDGVGRDKVKITRYVLPYGFGAKRDFIGINTVVASERLDCVVAALTSLSRERAKTLVREGAVRCDHLPERDPDRRIAEGCVIAVTGYGKYRIESIGEQTKKGRNRLLALKYN